MKRSHAQPRRTKPILECFQAKPAHLIRLHRNPRCAVKQLTLVTKHFMWTLQTSSNKRNSACCHFSLFLHTQYRNKAARKANMELQDAALMYSKKILNSNRVHLICSSYTIYCC